jgi:hypothetical protein
MTFVGWGTHFLDCDLDGWEDILIANGHAIRFPVGQAPRAQRTILFLNQGRGRFQEASRRGGSYFATKHVGRGIAFGDLDNDGRIDAVLSNLNEPVGLLRGIGGEGKHWLGIELATKDHRDLVGARVVVEAAGRKQTRFAKNGGSYASAHDPRLHFGLGDAERIERVTVIWPSGKEERWKNVKVDRYWRLTEEQKEAQAAVAKH